MGLPERRSIVPHRRNGSEQPRPLPWNEAALGAYPGDGPSLPMWPPPGNLRLSRLGIVGRVGCLNADASALPMVAIAFAVLIWIFAS